jgi:3-hydroxyacyl-CoA dehydrogenase
MTFSSVAVIGAGTMGAQIALHCANAGLRVLLLDVTAEAAREGLEKARRLKPDPQFAPDTHRLVTTADLDGGLRRLAGVSWIIEAVVERLEVKRQVFSRVDEVRRPGTVVSSNTSGLPIGPLAEGRSAAFRRHFLGTHFFNPPRYLHLVELIPTPDTDPAVVATLGAFLDRCLGKGVVVAKDTPNFIGNHLALYGVCRTLEAVAGGRYTIEEVDAITGPALGRPASATFRTLDLAGLDILGHVVGNLHERLSDAEDRAAFTVPPFLARMIERGALGEKAGRGFYERRRNAAGETDIWTLDLETLEYRPRRAASVPSLEAARATDDLRARVRLLFNARDRAGAFVRETLAPTLVYTARVAPDIAHSIDDVDRVMKWGFAWELGPFELIDAIGVREVVAAAEHTGGHAIRRGVPPLLQTALDAGRNAVRDTCAVPPAAPDLLILQTAREASRVVRRNAGASLLDLGEGVLAVELHSKMNTIGGDTVQMLQAGVREATKSGVALVVGTEAPNFSAGANLMLVLLEAQEGNWDELDAMVRTFQQATMALRYCDVPVVAAVGGLTLGGGAEMALHAVSVQAAAETYMGLVETGVGLIPSGGGTKEMIVRAMDARPSPQSDPLPYVQKAFETVALARVSASAADARRLGLLAATDGITTNRERLMADARTHALDRARAGYVRPAPRSAIPVGGASLGAALELGVHLAWRAGRATDHDRLVGQKLAHVFAGGDLPHATMVDEQYLLDLEREAFLSLLGEPKTLERVRHTLRTGKPLRN